MRRFFFLGIFFVSFAFPLAAQSILDKRVSVKVTQQRLDDVLTIIGNKGGFSFSYNSTILKRDSLVSLAANDLTVRQILNQLFNGNYEYKQSGNYIILRRIALQVTTITQKDPVEDKTYNIAGYVVNSETGERVPHASIYEKQHLVATLTDINGNFHIRLKSKHRTASLAVSRDAYEDTTVLVEPKYDMKLVIAIVPEIKETYTATPNIYEQVDTFSAKVAGDMDTASVAKEKAGEADEVEKTAAGKFLLSARQKIQSLNLKNFFTEKPVQLSVIPGVSTQGIMSPQVISNFSFNLVGGYTGGVRGMEVGGVFNLNRTDVRYLQAAGVFNVVGGSFLGLQAAGVHNNVLKNLTGLQVAGVSNYAKGKLTGAQVAGVYNHTSDSVNGLQIAGVANYSRKKNNGVQIAGLGNFSNREIKGIQIAGVFNYAKRMKGVQIGLINVSDSIDGLGIGLINIVFKGYHKLTVSTNEIVDATVAFKTGSRSFYNILLAGTQVHNRDKGRLWTFGYGLGTAMKLDTWLSVHPELTSQYLYLGTWDYLNLLNKLQLNLNIQLGKRFALFGGPSFTVYYSDQLVAVNGFAFSLPPAGYKTFAIGLDKTRSWIGWNAGISFF